MVRVIIESLAEAFAARVRADAEEADCMALAACVGLSQQMRRPTGAYWRIESSQGESLGVDSFQ